MRSAGIMLIQQRWTSLALMVMPRSLMTPGGVCTQQASGL